MEPSIPDGGPLDTVKSMYRVPLLVGVLVTLVACGGGSEDNGAAGGTDTASPAAAAVELQGETLDGEPLSLADFRGKTVFVNVWASW